MTPEATSKTVLIADDELNMRRVLEAILRREGYDVITAANGIEALSGMTANVHTVITDLKMPGLDGMGLLKKLSADYPDVPVVMITAHGSVDNAVEAVKLGAFDYLEKPFEQEQIRQIVSQGDEHLRARAARRPRPRCPAGRGRFKLIGQSGAIRQIFVAVEKVADTPSTVLITGESGTGKELVARALHENSSRHTGPFIKINCAAIPKTLMESELFGYEKGAFTGAVGAKPGRFELAHGGTLFLDEIGEIPIEMQVKLLRVLQESEFERVGGIKTIKVDVRLVAATNRDLAQEVATGGFREDLYYRLNVVPLHLPPLRERREDIPLLAEHFIAKFNERLKKQVDRHHRRGAAAPGGLPLAGQHPRARERDGADDPVLRGAGDPAREPAARAPAPGPDAGRRRRQRPGHRPGDGRGRQRRAGGAHARPRPRPTPMSLPSPLAPPPSARELAEGGRARGNRARRARAHPARARRDRRQRHPGGAQAQDLAQEPADEDEGVRPARPRDHQAGRPGALSAARAPLRRG